MKRKKPKEVPVFFDLDPLKHFIESQTELSKKDLLTRIAGKVSYPSFSLSSSCNFTLLKKRMIR